MNPFKLRSCMHLCASTSWRPNTCTLPVWWGGVLVLLSLLLVSLFAVSLVICGIPSDAKVNVWWTSGEGWCCCE